MEYKRQEGFRLDFPQGLSGTFRIIKLGERYINSKAGVVVIHDISLKGAKFSTPLVLPSGEEKLTIELQFEVNNQLFSIRGNIVWKKENQNRCMYGVSFDQESYSPSDLLEELKQYVRKRNEK